MNNSGDFRTPGSAQNRNSTTPTNAPSSAANATPQCNQQDEAARSECERRDMTNDQDLPAGVTRSMRNRQMDRTRTASAPAGARRNTTTESNAAPSNGNDDESTQEESESTNDSDTLGGAPKR
jgi:hypothetical protein